MQACLVQAIAAQRGPQLAAVVTHIQGRGLTEGGVGGGDAHLGRRQRPYLWGRHGRSVRLGQVLVYVDQKGARCFLACQLRSIAQPL